MSFIKDYKAYAVHTNSKIKPLLKINLLCMLFFRISYVFYKIKLLPLSKLFWLINRIVFSIDIDPGAHLKGGVVILHGVGVVIGRYVTAEGDFKIYQGATLGGNNGKESFYNGKAFSQPIIKANCIIGINAVVLGPVILNEGAKIGANAIVTKDVPANSVVVSCNKIVNQ
jgi:serine O-acetyltransferase